MMNWVTRSQRRAGRQSGVTLVEALVALVVMSFGMIALVGLMANLRRSGDLAKQRGEAVNLAQNELERIRSYTTLTSDDPTVIAFDNIATDSWVAVPDDTNTSFNVQRRVDDIKTSAAADARVLAKSIRVSVTWTDRTGESGSPQSVTLSTIVPRIDPAFSGVIGIAPAPGGTRQPSDRHPAIPVKAKDLGNEKSAFRPGSLTGQVWVFSNVTGVITSVCTVDPAKDVSLITTDDLVSCNNDMASYLLSGTIQFSKTDPANPAAPEASAFRLDLAIRDGIYYLPMIGADKQPVKNSSGEIVMLPQTAQAPAFTCFNDSPTGSGPGQSFVNYNCIVSPDVVTKQWSGRLELKDFNIGTGASDYRVCRYSADYNGNGTLETKKGNFVVDNYEHPDVYVKVTGSLSRQNFLVVPGPVACPGAPNVDPANGIFVDYKTVQHQPS